jgi:predicted ester cyclase
MNSRRLDLLDEIVAPDLIRHRRATPGLHLTGPQAFTQYLAHDSAVFPDSIQTARHVVAEGDLVAIWATFEGTQHGPMGPFPPPDGGCVSTSRPSFAWSRARPIDQLSW